MSADVQFQRVNCPLVMREGVFGFLVLPQGGGMAKRTKDAGRLSGRVIARHVKLTASIVYH